MSTATRSTIRCRRAIGRVRCAAAIAVVLAAIGCRGEPVPRGPAWVVNPAATPESVTVANGVRIVTQREAPFLLQVDSAFPDEDARLLWFRGRSTSLRESGSVVTLDGSGGAMEVDGALMATRVALGLETATVVSLAGGDRGEVWVSDTEGAVYRVGLGWRPRRVDGIPFEYPAVARDPRGGVWLFRSTEPLSYRLASVADPLFVRFDATGVPTDTIRGIRLPEHVLLAELANAGHLAVTDAVLYFAPLIRDEVVAMTRTGDTLWVARRALPQRREQPRLSITDATPVVDYSPVNLGIAIGPDGLVYVLSVPDVGASDRRVDAFDGATGSLVRTAHLRTAFPTIAVDTVGRLYAVNAFRVLTGVAPEDRPPFGPFALPTLDGDTLRHTALRGKVALVNFWASWCGPCRVEMPALAALASSIADGDFAFVTMNEDVEIRDAYRFTTEIAFDYPVALGRGKLQREFHYLGLPFTALLDRQGRIVYRWTGFAGAEQVEAIRSLIRAELDRDDPEAEVQESGSLTPGVDSTP